MTEPRSEPYLDGSALPVEAREPDVPPRPVHQRRSRTRLRAVLFVVLALLALAALVSIFWQPDVRLTSMPARTAAPPVVPAAPAERYPIAPTQVEQPPLDASDAAILAALAGVFGDGSLMSYVEHERVVRRIVATIDNLPRATAPPAQWPIKTTPGTLATVATDGRITIADSNRVRYAPYVRLLESVDAERFVAFYRRHYPLFEQAYRELGYPKGHFNDRAVEAIDTLMATPSLPQPPALTQPKVFLQFADRDLEALPAGQKLMLRIGGDNAARVKAKLAEIRAAITDPAVGVAR